MSATTVAELLNTLERRGVRLRVEGERLAFEAPAGILREADRQALRAHKAAVLALLRERQAREIPGVDWARVSLSQLNRVLEVAVPWADVPLILAPGCRIAGELRERDPKPGRVWCVCEVLDLVLTGVSAPDARRIGEAKLQFDATVVDCRRTGQ